VGIKSTKALENAGTTEEFMNELEKSRCGIFIGSGTLYDY
jgi:acyl transferase domain-containing protein